MQTQEPSFVPEAPKTLHHRYAQKYDDGSFHNVYKNYLPYYGGLVCGPEEEIFDVTFKECEGGSHDSVAWKRTGEDTVDFIFASRKLLDVCFPYGMDAAVKAGQGRMVYLEAISCTSCGKAGELKHNRAPWDKDGPE